MAKGMFKQERFSFRKMKVGLASVAILFAFAQLGQVSADETSKVSSSEITKVTEAPKVVEEVKSPIEEAKAEIATEKSRPIVKETEAKAGDLIDISKKESAVEVKESQEGNQKVHIETSVAEVTKTEIAPEKVEKIPEPVTTTKENTVAAKDKDGNSYTQYERVDKTTTVEITTTPPTVKKAGAADIVFVVDRSGSMG